MFGKNVFKKLKTGTLVAFLSTFTFFTSFLGIDSEATSTYYVRVLFDEGSFGLVSQVISDKAESKDWLERDGGVDFSAIADYKKVYKGGGDNKTPGSSLIANIVTNDPTKVDETYAEIKNSSDKNMGLVFSFPGLTNAIDDSIKYTALSSDMARAELVSNTLTKGVNDALAFIKTYSGKEHISGEGLRHILAQLARITAQFENGGGSGTFNTGKTGGSKGFSVIQVTGPNQRINGSKAKVGDELIPVNNLRYTDYVAISTTNSQGEIVYGYYPWRMAKGYHSDQELAPLVGTEYTDVAKSKENRYITWGQMIIQAGVNADVRGSTSIDSASDSMTLIGQGLGTDMTGAIVAIRSMLNLAPIQELVLNMGSRASTHHMGTMTQDMFNTAKTVYVLVFCVSLLLLSVIVVNTIHQKMLSTTNIVARVSFMEKLQDLVFVGVMLAIFPSVFELMLEVNYWIVKTFSYSSSYLQAYGITGSKVLSTESMAGAMVSTMFLSIDIYINMTYLTRSILLAFLFAISPLVTVLYPLGSMQKKMYIGYFRELVGTIFMQSFHAIVMCFFAGYNTTNMSAMEAIVSTYCFIPVTQLFKTFVVGHTGFTESVGGKLAGQLTNTASGLHKSNLMMKQSQEIMDLQAKNAKNLSMANFGAQVANIGADIGGSLLHSNTMNQEIGANIGANATKGATKSTNGLSSLSSNSNMKGAMKGVGVGLAGAGIGALATGLTEKSNKSELGKMQMEHSMQNIGAGLAQAGIGLGISSYDAGSGNSMISAGMSSVQQGAKEYGAGESNAGAGGTYSALANGAQTAQKITGVTVGKTLNNAMYNHNNIAKENMRLADMQYQQRMKEQSRGLDVEGVDGTGALNNTANYIGMKSANGQAFSESYPAPIAKIEPHVNNTDSSTIVLNPANLKNASSDDALANLGKAFEKYQDANAPEVKQAWEKASREYGVSNTIAPSMTDDGKIAIVMNRVSAKGFEVDASGRTYTSSESLNNQ